MMGPTESRYYSAIAAFLVDIQAAHKVGSLKGSRLHIGSVKRMASCTDTQSLFTESQYDLHTPENMKNYACHWISL